MRCGSNSRVVSRRIFLGGVGAAMVATPLIAEAQQTAPPARLGYLGIARGPLSDAFLDGLRVDRDLRPEEPPPGDLSVPRIPGGWRPHVVWTGRCRSLPPVRYLRAEGSRGCQDR